MKKLQWISLLSLVLFSASVNASSILLTQFDFTGYSDMKTNLEADGHTVDIVDARTGGALASALSSNTYDQVFLFDLTANSYLNNDDISAISSFWNTSKGIVVDTRSYGYHFQGNDPSEVALLQNVARNLELSGGGLWVGTDHDPQWTRNANPVLAELGFNPVTGSFSNPVNYADPTSVLLQDVTPEDLWGGGQTIGQAPIGMQPNGLEMFIHFGHLFDNGDILPYISANFDLAGPDPDPDVPPVSSVPEPGTIFLLGAGLLGMAARRKGRIAA